MSGAFDRNEQTIEDNPLNQWFRFRVFDRSESGVQDFSATRPRYDLDGNLLSDGRWTYSWDGENRLVKMVSVAWTQPAGGYLANATYPAITLEFAYDGLSRRVQKKTITGGTPTLEGYLYDGWNVVMISKLDPANLALPMRKWSCVWRPDVGSRLYARGSWQVAGGVGGLAWMQTGIAQTVAMYTYQSVTGNADVRIPMMDHMGNVRHYYQIKSTGPGTGAATVTGQVTANLDYDAFGREVRSTGPKTPATSQPPGLAANDPWVDNLPFHFSTKFTDRESGLNYYGYRFYDPVDGRWISSDPIGENGGLNLLTFDENNFLCKFDLLGLHIYAAFFYNRDFNRSFERVALTWQREKWLEVRICEDSVIVKGVGTEAESRSAWDELRQEAINTRQKIQELRIFTHSGKDDTGRKRSFKPGLYLEPDGEDDGLLQRKEIMSLPRLPWGIDALLKLHGCRSGLEGRDNSEEGASVAQSFSDSQGGVRTEGKSGFGYFSTNPDRYAPIDKRGPGTSQTVYLKPFTRGLNNAAGLGNAVMPPVVYGK